MPENFFAETPPSTALFTPDLQMQQFAASLKPTLNRVVQHRPTHLPTELKTYNRVLVKVDPLKPNLVSPYAGPIVVMLL